MKLSSIVRIADVIIILVLSLLTFLLLLAIAVFTVMSGLQSAFPGL
jgi:hypothetical protein